MNNVIKKYRKTSIFSMLFLVIISAIFIFSYLRVKEPTINEISGDAKYSVHQYLTKDEIKEREQIEKDFTENTERAGKDTEKQKKIAEDHLNNVSDFNKKIFHRNEVRFQKYTDELDSYFRQHPENKNGDIFKEYAYFTANVELNLFNQASKNLENIDKKIQMQILEK